MLTYLLEVTLCWTLLYGIFYLCMRRETFFKINRWYLLSALLFGLLIPLLRLIPVIEEVELYNRQVAEYIPIVYAIKDTPAIVAHTITEQSIEWGSIFQLSLWVLYAAGCLFFLFRFTKGLRSIYKLYHQGEKSVSEKHTLIKTAGDHLPFSFLHMIFVSKTLPLNEDYNRILTHELEHVRARHSIDVILLEIINIVFWFHPMIYLYKSALRQTHEYLADAAVCGNDSRQLYGQLLLRQSLSGLEIALAHHFFHSHIKKRINMIYQEKSGRKAWLKYALAVPALAVLMLMFTSQTIKTGEVQGQETSHLTDEDTDLSSLLNENQKRLLLSELNKVIKATFELTTLEKEEQITVIFEKWANKYPQKQEDIHKTISIFITRDNYQIFRNDENDKFVPIQLWIPNNEAIESNDLFSPSLPDIEELSILIEGSSIPNEVSVVHKYFQFQSYYSDNGKREKEILELFEQYLSQNKGALAFTLKDIRLEFNITAPKLILDYAKGENEVDFPVFWGQDFTRTTPIHNRIDFRNPIGFLAYLTPLQAQSLFGPEGRNGIIAASNYTLSPNHPQLQSEAIKREIENFFSTINQLPEESWVNKLKEVRNRLESKYPKVHNSFTPYTFIAKQHDITLEFYEGEIIKAFRGNAKKFEAAFGKNPSRIPEKKLLKAVKRILEKRINDEDKIKELEGLYDQWRTKYPNEVPRIKDVMRWVSGKKEQKTGFTKDGKLLLNRKRVAFTESGKILLYSPSYSLPGNSGGLDKAYDMVMSDWILPTYEELKIELEKPYETREIGFLHNYLELQGYFYNDKKTQAKATRLFERYAKEHRINLGFELSELNIQYNITSPKELRSLISQNVKPVFWGQGSPARTFPDNFEISDPIGMFVYLTPDQATKIFGQEGQQGFVGMSYYTLGAKHPFRIKAALDQDIRNFFSTIDQLPPSSWINKLKKVHTDLSIKYGDDFHAITPFSNAAHQHNITLVFKEGKIIKAYRGDGNSTERIDKESKAKFPQGSSSQSATERRLDTYPKSTIKLSNSFIKSANENFIVPKDAFHNELEIVITGNLSEEVDLYKRITLQDKHRKERSEYYYYITFFDNNILSDLKISEQGILTFKNSDLVKTETTITAIIIEKESFPQPKTIQDANIKEAIGEFDTIITYNPETFEETIEIRPSHGSPSVPVLRSGIEQKATEKLIVEQNSPNPFTDATEIGFKLPQSGITHLTICGINGISVYEKTSLFEQGKNTIRVEADDLNGPGVYYYTLKADGYEESRKMKVLNKTTEFPEEVINMDTIITYNPVTYEETIEIKPANRNKAPQDLIYNLTSTEKEEIGLRIDTIVTFDPITFKESFEIHTYPYNISSETYDFKWQLDKKAQQIILSEYPENSTFLIQSQEGNILQEIKTPTYILNSSHVMSMDIQDLAKGYNYITMRNGPVVIKKRFLLQ